MKQVRISGWLLIATGILHNSLGLFMGLQTLQMMHQAGWIASADPSVVGHFRSFALLWFELLGSFWVVLGSMMLSWSRISMTPLPRYLGLVILISALVAAILIPASGAWLLIPQGWYIIRTAHRYPETRSHREKRPTTMA